MPVTAPATHILLSTNNNTHEAMRQRDEAHGKLMAALDAPKVPTIGRSQLQWGCQIASGASADVRSQFLS